MDLGDANVVRFPRDWLGPREELIPFGPSAEGPSNDTRSAGRPPTADDFWGESSSSIQDALQAPEGGLGAPDPSGLGASENEPTLIVAGRGRGRAREGIGGRRLTLSILGLAAAALMTGLVLIATGTHKPGAGGLLAARSGRSSAGSSSATSQLTHGSGVTALERRDHLRNAASARASRRPANSQRSTNRRSSASRRARSAPRSAPHVAHRRGSAGASPKEVQRVGYTTPTPPSGGGSSASPPAPPSPSPQQTATVSSGDHSSGSGAQPALGANGALAPGSSPDG